MASYTVLSGPDLEYLSDRGAAPASEGGPNIAQVYGHLALDCAVGLRGLVCAGQLSSTPPSCCSAMPGTQMQR